MSKTVACVVVKSAKLFSWLGHMPIMNWSLTQLHEVRGVDRIVCVAHPQVADRARKLLAKEDIEVVTLPRELVEAKDAVLDKWLTAASGPAGEADIVVVTTATSPFMPAAKIEACLNNVAKGKCSTCVPARDANVVSSGSSRKSKMKAAVEAVRVFRVNVPVEQTTFHTVAVNLMESLDVENQDEFVLASAMVESDKV